MVKKKKGQIHTPPLHLQTKTIQGLAKIGVPTLRSVIN
jgi:hypothetical protein